MDDADAFAALNTVALVVEGDDTILVLEPDRTRSPEARCGEAHEVGEEDAAARVASAFWHELELASPGPLRVRYHNTTCISATNSSEAERRRDGN